MRGLFPATISDDDKAWPETRVLWLWRTRARRDRFRDLDVWRVVQSVPNTRTVDFISARWKHSTGRKPYLISLLTIIRLVKSATWKKNVPLKIQILRQRAISGLWLQNLEITKRALNVGRCVRHRLHTGSWPLCVVWPGELQGVSATFH